MSDMRTDKASAEAAEKTNAVPDADGQFGRGYILKQIEKILDQKDYLHEAIKSLSQMTDGENGESYAPGNLLGQAKANALKDIVCYRETTNQQLLKMYEKMYYDLQGKGDCDLQNNGDCDQQNNRVLAKQGMALYR